MLWRPDPSVDATRKLPEWAAFHRLCGQHGLAFDGLERSGRQYRCRAVSPKKTSQGGYVFIDQGTGEGRTVIDALREAYGQSGITVPGAEEMLSRGLSGVVEDDFEGLLG